ncbi:MAG: hypothetical protein ACRD2L_10340, partial [Terriglobia bacterium]
VGCRYSNSISGTITATVSGSGTTQDPYTGRASFAGRYVITLVQAQPPFTCPALVEYPFDGSLPISGSFGQVEVHEETLIGRVDFVGTVRGDTLAGTLTVTNEGWDSPITISLTLSRVSVLNSEMIRDAGSGSVR